MIADLRDVVRDSGNDDSCDATHTANECARGGNSLLGISVIAWPVAGTPVPDSAPGDLVVPEHKLWAQSLNA